MDFSHIVQGLDEDRLKKWQEVSKEESHPNVFEEAENDEPAVGEKEVRVVYDQFVTAKNQLDRALYLSGFSSANAFSKITRSKVMREAEKAIEEELGIEPELDPSEFEPQVLPRRH